jgi:hypothetical protein
MITEHNLTNTLPITVAELFGSATVEFGGSVVHSRTIPDFIPADQAYFWSVPWQAAERRALADIEAGRSRSFADPAAAVRYLLGTDEA